jgi:hypothetical protein
MNHFLDEALQQDFAKTEELIKENPLGKIKPGLFKQSIIKEQK